MLINSAIIKESLNIVSFNIPSPPNYGGIIDVYYKAKALHELGVKVHLHCFSYGRSHDTSLEEICEKVYYYPRQTGLRSQFSYLPYIVYSRRNTNLLKNLLENDFPILFEGLHTTYYLDNELLNHRVKIVRNHNIEHNYYAFLSQQEKNPIKKLYFKLEALKLQFYCKKLEQAQLLANISSNDDAFFKTINLNSFILPPFHSNHNYKALTGLGNYCIYHGNLSVPENIKALEFIIESLGSTSIPVYIAGKNPSKKLKSRLKNTANFQLHENIGTEAMDGLIQNAQLVLLPTFQNTGVKLKLIHSMYLGRHLLCTPKMIENTGLEAYCTIASNITEFKQQVLNLMQIPISDAMLAERKNKLHQNYDNGTNADELMQKINGI